MNREILSSLLVLVVGFFWYYANLYWVGFMSIWIYLALYTHHGINPILFYAGGLAGTVLAQLVLSLLIAWFISHIQPRRWLRYSVLVLLPVIAMSMTHFYRNAENYRDFMWVLYSIETLLLLVQVPFLLFLFYRIIDRRNRVGRAGEINGNA